MADLPGYQIRYTSVAEYRYDGGKTYVPMTPPTPGAQADLPIARFTFWAVRLGDPHLRNLGVQEGLRIRRPSTGEKPLVVRLYVP